MKVEVGTLFLLLAFVLTITSKKVAEEGSKAKAAGGSGTLSSKINDVSPDELTKLIKDNEYAIVYFYDDDKSKVQFGKQVSIQKYNNSSEYSLCVNKIQ